MKSKSKKLKSLETILMSQMNKSKMQIQSRNHLRRRSERINQREEEDDHDDVELRTKFSRDLETFPRPLIESDLR